MYLVLLGELARYGLTHESSACYSSITVNEFEALFKRYSKVRGLADELRHRLAHADAEEEELREELIALGSQGAGGAGSRESKPPRALRLAHGRKPVSAAMAATIEAIRSVGLGLFHKNLVAIVLRRVTLWGAIAGLRPIIG